MLTVKLHAIGHPVEKGIATTPAGAAALVVAWQDEHGYGSRDLASDHGVILQEGKSIGRVSYNGRVITW